MRFYIAAFFSVLTIVLYGQAADSLGINNHPRLNKSEAEYFNLEFKEWRKEFDFTEKKVAFLTGSSAGKYMTKVDYFNEVKTWLKGNKGITQFAWFLTEKEKLESGGYDAIVLCWVKLLTEKRRRQIITELNFKE